jgi:hypothetical protein
METHGTQAIECSNYLVYDQVSMHAWTMFLVCTVISDVRMSR